MKTQTIFNFQNCYNMYYLNENYNEPKQSNHTNSFEKQKIEQSTQYATWKQLPEITYLSSYENTMRSSTSELENKSQPILKQVHFDKALIALVRKNNTLWDKNCKMYRNKEIKLQLWQSIAQILNTDVNSSITRWRELREKYNNHKTKEGGFEKDGLIEELKFLDKITFNNTKDIKQIYNHQYFQTSDSCSSINSNQEDSSEFISQDELKSTDMIVIQPSDKKNLSKAVRHQIQTSENFNTSKKTESTKASETLGNKSFSTNESIKMGKEPEDLFGELVSSLLKRVPDDVKHGLMIEIMLLVLKH